MSDRPDQDNPLPPAQPARARAPRAPGRWPFTPMKWTSELPTMTGWYWFRHTVGPIDYDAPVHCQIMRRSVQRRGRWIYVYNKRSSVYWEGQWRDVADMPTGYQFKWSDQPIRPPNGSGVNAANPCHRQARRQLNQVRQFT